MHGLRLHIRALAATDVVDCLRIARSLASLPPCQLIQARACTQFFPSPKLFLPSSSKTQQALEMLSSLDTTLVGPVNDTEDVDHRLTHQKQMKQETSISCTSEPSPRAGRVILLNGFPGVGKYSIGRKLHTLFDLPHVRFVDNHVLIDPVQSIAPGLDSDHKELRRAFRKLAFDALCNIPDQDVTIILTSCLSSTAEDREVFKEHSRIASCRGIPIYIFNIICASNEHNVRLSAPERPAGTKMKLLDPKILDSMMSKHRLIRLSDLEQSHEGNVERSLFELDTSGQSIEESADKILATVTQSVME